MAKYVQLKDTTTGEPIYPITVRDNNEVIAIENGGTGAITLKDARQTLHYIGRNPIASPDEDIVAKWLSFGSGFAYIASSGFLKNQPAEYGFVENIVMQNGSSFLVKQIWHTQTTSGTIYKRAGNTNGWYSEEWVKVFDSKGVIPIENGGTGATTVADARTNLGAAETGHTHWSLNNSNGGQISLMYDSSTYYLRPYSADYNSNLGGPSYRWQHIYSKNALNVSSDRRLKEELDTDFDKYVEMLNKIEPTSYYRVDESGDMRKRHTGYIAQDVYKAMKEVGLEKCDFAGFSMDMQEDGNVYTYGLVYEEFIPILHAKIKQLEARIEELENTIVEEVRNDD